MPVSALAPHGLVLQEVVRQRAPPHFVDAAINRDGDDVENLQARGVGDQYHAWSVSATGGKRRARAPLGTFSRSRRLDSGPGKAESRRVILLSPPKMRASRKPSPRGIMSVALAKASAACRRVRQPHTLHVQAQSIDRHETSNSHSIACDRGAHLFQLRVVECLVLVEQILPLL